jgi:hypothetical protein
VAEPPLDLNNYNVVRQRRFSPGGHRTRRTDDQFENDRWQSHAIVSSSSATPRLRRLAAPFELAPSLALFG